MKHTRKPLLLPSIVVGMGLLAGSSLLSCSGNKNTEQATVNSTVDTTKGVLGRQGDTTGSNPTMDQQAPPDSAQMSGPTVIEDIKVRPKK